jgi:hypothetical protein
LISQGGTHQGDNVIGVQTNVIIHRNATIDLREGGR